MSATLRTRGTREARAGIRGSIGQSIGHTAFSARNPAVARRSDRTVGVCVAATSVSNHSAGIVPYVIGRNGLRSVAMFKMASHTSGCS